MSDQNFERFLAGWLLLIACGAFICFLTGIRINSDLGDGIKYGIITKISKEGIFNKTNELELSHNYFQEGNGQFGMSTFNFTVDNDHLLKIANQAIESREEVILKYHKSFLYNRYYSECGAYATEIIVK